MVKYLHQKDKSVLYDLSRDSTSDLSSYIKPAADGLRMPLQIDDRLYMEKNTSTAAKLHLLRKLFALYQADPDDLVFYLRDSDSSQNAENARSDLRLQYWTYALPIIQKQNLHRGTFGSGRPGLPPLRSALLLGDQEDGRHGGQNELILLCRISKNQRQAENLPLVFLCSRSADPAAPAQQTAVGGIDDAFNVSCGDIHGADRDVAVHTISRVFSGIHS